jgi:hypothetical protein
MGRLKKILTDSEYAYEMSDAVKGEKLKLQDEICKLMEDYFDDDEISVYGDGIMLGDIEIAGIWYDHVFDKNFDEYYYTDDVTLNEMKSIISAVKEIIEKEF